MTIQQANQYFAALPDGFADPEQLGASYPQRRELFENQKKTVEKEIERLQKTLDMLRFKCWYYDTAIADGNEDRINEMLPNNLPDDIQKLYDHAHSDDED